MSASSTYVESDMSVYCLASDLAETILFLLGKTDPLGTFFRCFFQWSGVELLRILAFVSESLCLTLHPNAARSLWPVDRLNQGYHACCGIADTYRQSLH
jgi:hypothetical protein